MLKQATAVVVVCLLASSVVARAGEADVVKAEAVPLGEGVWRFTVTVRHADEGWNHYANSFQILDMDGNVLGTRTLHHPHENEQPFTRSLGGVSIPATVKRVRIRAGDSVHEYGGTEVVLELPIK